jgi:hypothetical protein
MRLVNQVIKGESRGAGVFGWGYGDPSDPAFKYFYGRSFSAWTNDDLSSLTWYVKQRT